MSFVGMLVFAFWFHAFVVSLLTDPCGTVHRVLAPVRFVHAMGLRMVWATMAVFFTARFMYESSCYLYLMETDGLLPEIAPANPVPVLLSDDRGWSRLVRPPPVETRLLEAFW
ncbi:hypothetical protein BGZ93_008708, partial [Podila epicladia]